MAEMDIHGNIIHRARPSLPDTRYTPSYSSSLNWWDRLNNFVIDIGNWFAEYAEGITETVMGISGIGAIIGLVIWVIGIFGKEGAIWGVFSIFGAMIIGYVLFAIIGILSYILGFALLIIRYLFWNIYTLLISLVIVAILIFMNTDLRTQNASYNNSIKQEQYHIPQTTKYTCTANDVLNVRYAPNVNSRVIGTVQNNQIVDVYEISDGFAKIKFNSDVGYASIKYLRKYQ